MNYLSIRKVLLLDFSWSNYYNFLQDFQFNQSVSVQGLNDFCIKNLINFDLLINKLNPKN